MSYKGNRAFDNCDVRVVKFEKQIVDGDGIIVTKGRERAQDENFFLGGYGAKLVCPKTIDDGSNISSRKVDHPSQIDALYSLRDLAGQVVCATCRYSDMTPVQVSIERKELAEAEKLRLEAYQLLAEARTELDVIDHTLPASTNAGTREGES